LKCTDGLLPCREVTAFVELVVMDKFGKRFFGPATRGWRELVREDAHGNRWGEGNGEWFERLTGFPEESLQHSVFVGLAPQILEKFSEFLLQQRHTLPSCG